ncbi:ABC transporter ATP-binding protein [Candidatus Nomurabacteria bacterium]|nr:ABC transporter ATP-binding protein [Candidatus Nomurabacteria bacterium]
MQYSSVQLIKDIWELLKPYKWRFFLASIIRLVGDLANLYTPFALALIIDFITTYKAGNSLRYVWIVLGLLFLAHLVRNLSQYFSKYLGFFIAAKINIDSTLKTIRHMFLLDMAWHEKENSGNKVKRIQNAGDGFTKIIRLYFNNIIEICVNLVAINIIIFTFDREVLFILVIFLATYFFASFFFIRKAARTHLEVNKQEEEVNGILFEAVNNVRTVKIMSMAENLYDILSSFTEDLMKKIKTTITWFQFRWSFLSLWTATFKIGIMIVIIYGIINGQYALGFLVLFLGYFSDLRESIDELSTSLQDFVTSKYSIARMKDILNEPIKIDNEEGKMLLSPGWEKIEFKNVSFSYGENRALDSVSFEINRGEKVGIVGLSGAGKSTLFKLLLKEREKFTGDILFDGVSIKKISKKDYFNQVSVVLQDTEVFNFSLRDNITITNYGQKENQKLLEQALAVAHMKEVADKLPQGLDTIIGEKGVKLSGGERQRLGIARAIFKNPKILLLDEATSHLDLESEEKIKDSLHRFFENVTAIVIAHRLTTIKEMDKILVIENGKLIESGSFEELIVKQGRFFQLWEKQKL